MTDPTLPVGQAAYMPGTEGFTMVCFKASDVPAGTNLYTLPPMDEDADIYLIARVFAEFRKDACIHGNDRVDGAFIKAARVLMGAASAADDEVLPGVFDNAEDLIAALRADLPLRISKGNRDGGWLEFDVNDHYGAIRVVARMEGDSEDLPLGKLIEKFLLSTPSVNAQAADIPDTVLVDLFYAANGDISKFRIKARTLLTANGAKP